MDKKFFIAILVLVFIVAIFGVFKCISFRRVSEDTNTDFRSAPDFTLLDIHGNEKKLSDFKDKVIILDFWATWCPPCRMEIPHFIDLYNEYKDEGLEVIGVALDRNVERVGPFAEEIGINYTVLLGNRDVTDLYGGIMSIPTTFILDRDGKIRKKYIGYRDKEVFEKDIKELL